MATNRKNLSVNSTDFDTIKANFKSFLSGQEVLKDYDYEGSALATLVDLLAYNTYYQAFYNNVVANELFLDSAVKRASVVSHAKMIGYTASSITAPIAIVNLTYGENPGTTVLLPGAQFTTTVNSQTYTFVNTDSANIVETNGVYSITGLVLREGSLVSETYVVPDSSNENTYTITNENADTSTIKVRVQASQNDTTGLTDVWSRSTDLTAIDGTSTVFFLEENSRGEFEIFFGDGILGKKLETGNIVTITYLITSGAETNGASSFRYLNDSNTVETTSPASGGASRESINKIRFRAPRAFSAQNRAVTKNDYASLIESNFSAFDSVFVFGGEEADPPTYGSVFVALKPATGTVVTSSLKENVRSFLVDKAVLGIRPVVIDPDYTYLRFEFDVLYDPQKTSLSASSINSTIRNAVTLNLSQNLGEFNQSFSISKLLSAVDASSSSIDSSAVAVTMEKRFLATSTKNISYTLDYANPIYHPHEGHSTVVYSGDFRYLDPNDGQTKDVFLEDDGFGNISLLKSGTRDILYNNIGSVEYKTGKITINPIQILSPTDVPYIRVFARAGEKRYVSVREKIIINDYLSDASAIKITLNGIEQLTGTTVGTQQSNALSSVTSTYISGD